MIPIIFQHTPADYQPPGFMPASPVMSLTFGLKTVNDKLGKVSTRFHTLKGEVTSPDFEESPEPVQPQLSAVDHRQVSSQVMTFSARLEKLHLLFFLSLVFDTRSQYQKQILPNEAKLRCMVK